MHTGIHIGADSKTTKEVAAAILAILKVPYADNKTKRQALKVLEKATSVSNTTVSNCNIQG